MLHPRALRRDELPVPAARLARWLIGKTLVRQHPAGRMSGRIVETEAYVVGDASGHAYRGKTNRNASLFLEPGHAYVYFVYGCWFSLNVSAGRSWHRQRRAAARARAARRPGADGGQPARSRRPISPAGRAASPPRSASPGKRERGRARPG